MDGQAGGREGGEGPESQAQLLPRTFVEWCLDDGCLPRSRTRHLEENTKPKRRIKELRCWRNNNHRKREGTESQDNSMAVRPRSKSFGDSLVHGHRRKVSDTTSTKSDGSSGSSSSNGNKDRNRSEQKGRARSNSYYRDRSNSHHRRPQSKKDLWKGALEVDIGQGVTVQMIGLDSANRTVYARIDPACSATPETLASTPLSKVIEVMVDESHRRLAHQILEKKLHVEVDSFPNADQLLQLGSGECRKIGGVCEKMISGWACSCC